MISDEQRRKIAEELRSEAEGWRDLFPDAMPEGEGIDAAIMFDLIGFVGLDDESPVHAIYARLADLIDRPTCNNVSDFGSHTVTQGDYFKGKIFDFVCNRCGFRLIGDERYNSPLVDYRFSHYGIKFCPSCGAEVVE